MSTPPPALAHTFFEDVQALLTATLCVALGVTMYRAAGLLTGGTAGVAFLIHYASGWRFGTVFFLVNLPFAAFAWRTLGRRFTLKSLAAVMLLSGLTEVIPLVLHFDRIDPLFASAAGGVLIGVGLLILFRHQSSLGGVNVVVLWLQQHRGWRAGKVQMAIDCAIVLAALAIVPPVLVAISVLGAVVLNLVLAVNHKPGRYLGV